MEDAFYFRHGLVPSAARPSVPRSALQSVADVLDAGCSLDPDALALADRHTRYTYAELVEASVRAASALADLGVAPGDRVGACLPNQTEIVVAFLGAMRLSALWVGVPRELPLEGKLGILDDADVSVLLADRETHDLLQPHRSALRDLNRIVVADPGPSEWNLALDREEEPAPPEDVDPFAPAAIAYTEDAAGRLRGVVHTQHNLVLPGVVTAAREDAAPGQRFGAALPVTRLDALVVGPLRAFQSCGACIVTDRSDPEGMAAWTRDEGIASLAADPTAGGYGLTEAPAAVTVPDPDGPPVPGSRGRALPHLEVAIVDVAEREVPDGEEGEIVVRAATTGRLAGVWTPMLGYWNQPDATREAVRGGTLHTGDRGRLDERGHLFVSARARPGG